MEPSEGNLFHRIAHALRRALDEVAPGPEARARRELAGLQAAYCALLMEVARLESTHPELKRAAVAHAMKETFALGNEAVAPLMDAAGGKVGRMTSYYEPLALIRRHASAEQRVRFVEQLWRVAFADGDIDPYEDQLVRKLSELLYVAHADFIPAKHRVRAGTTLSAAAQ